MIESEDRYPEALVRDNLGVEVIVYTPGMLHPDGGRKCRQRVHCLDDGELLVAENSDGWDRVLLACYPPSQALADTVSDPDDARAAQARSERLAESMLHSTCPVRAGR